MNPTTVNRKKWSASNDFENASPLPYVNDQAGGAQIINSGLFFQNHIFLYKSGHLHAARGLPIQPDVINPIVLSGDDEAEGEDGTAEKKIKTTTPVDPPPPPKP